MIGLKGSRGPLVLAVLGFLALAGSALAAPKFPPLTGRVVDEAHLLSPEATDRLTGELAQLETQTGHQLVVATVPSLQGYEIEDYGYQLGRTWGIGSKAQNDGVILLVAPAERKVRIEVGYGLEPVLTDALSSVIIQEKILPQFRAGRMEQGVVDGAEAIIAQLGLPEDQAKAIAQAPPQQAQIRTQGVHIPGVVILFIIIWVLSSLLRGRRGGGGGFGGGGGSFGGGGSSGGW